MATFVYYWKTPDNVRHEGEVEAVDRDAAFAQLRERGIRAIKVEPKGWETGQGFKGVKKRVVFFSVVAASLITGLLVYWGVSHRAGADHPASKPSHGTVSHYVASPLPRQVILGRHERIETCPTNLFKHAAETTLSKFAEPGRPVDFVAFKFPDEAAVKACLNDPISISSDELTEYIDLKRIVVGMKRELASFLAAGDTLEHYVTALVSRQKTEIAYREKAANHLKEMLSAKEPQLSAAYAYWLKANASLQAMGIYPLELPPALRTYQLSLDLDSNE